MVKAIKVPALKKTDMEIVMSIKFTKQNIFVPEMQQLVADGMWRGFNHIRYNFESIIMKGLILGGPGWYSLEQMPSWRWLNSPEGIAQMGFTDANTPLSLLFTLMDSFKVETIGRPVVKRRRVNMGLEMKFFNLDEISRKTQHPAAGEGKLSSTRSWFDWFYKGKAISEPAKFVKVKSTSKGPRSSAISGNVKGLMNDKQGGLWSVAPKFRLDLNKLIDRNEVKIQKTLEKVLVREMNIYFRS